MTTKLYLFFYAYDFGIHFKCENHHLIVPVCKMLLNSQRDLMTASIVRNNRACILKPTQMQLVFQLGDLKNTPQIIHNKYYNFFTLYFMFTN